MFNILMIGLDIFSKQIINYLKLAKYKNIVGFDFDIDKINSFKNENLISNFSNINLNDLMKEADIIILNIEFLKYENIFIFLPFIKKECIIINTNIYKGNIKEIRKLLKNRSDNFMPCNFLLIPNMIILNYDSETKMNLILSASNFLKTLQIKTSILNPTENDEMFSIVYQIPYIFSLILLKNSDLFFIPNEKEYKEYSFCLEDILLNKKNILFNMESFLKNFSNLDDDKIIFDLLNNYNLNYLKFDNISKQNINEEIMIKILLEKIFIKTFLQGKTDHYKNINYINFDYIKYDIISLEEYFLYNKGELKISIIIFKEKIINILSLLQFEDLSLNKFIKYMNN